MVELKALNCPNCGSQLNASQLGQVFQCEYCLSRIYVWAGKAGAPMASPIPRALDQQVDQASRQDDEDAWKDPLIGTANDYAYGPITINTADSSSRETTVVTIDETLRYVGTTFLFIFLLLSFFCSTF